ncbi:hypothetical protein [Microbacterium esteraromaticum]|uniref:hypothetical protein n=1 Tax=Microbacterium esteraromaticum TaxID=57043 RepID=UPI001957D3AC|nr:hypothetical protein [Microbacterium esteraromaticum]MBM7467329.1 hypothetical protein [Microbacterium esteraromaticum]
MSDTAEVFADTADVELSATKVAAERLHVFAQLHGVVGGFPGRAHGVFSELPSTPTPTRSTTTWTTSQQAR